MGWSSWSVAPPTGTEPSSPGPRYVPPEIQPWEGGFYVSPRNALMRARQAWADHAALTRSLILAYAQGGPSPDRVLDALDANARVIAGTLGAYYGEGASSAFYGLLSQHLKHIANLAHALATGDTGNARALDAAAQENATAIADFLNSQDASAFPRWEWRSLLRDHVAVTAQEAAAAKDPERFAHWWDAARRNAEMIGAMFFRAVYVRTPFSNRFRSPYGREVLGTTFGEAARGLPGLYR